MKVYCSVEGQMMATIEELLQDIKDRFTLRYMQSDYGWPPHPINIIPLQKRGYLDEMGQLTPAGESFLQSENE
jgi:hypothetical protein